MYSSYHLILNKATPAPDVIEDVTGLRFAFAAQEGMKSYLNISGPPKQISDFFMTALEAQGAFGSERVDELQRRLTEKIGCEAPQKSVTTPHPDMAAVIQWADELAADLASRGELTAWDVLTYALAEDSSYTERNVHLIKALGWDTRRQLRIVAGHFLRRIAEAALEVRRVNAYPWEEASHA